MKSTMFYKGATYGNTTNASEYTVTLKRANGGSAISVSFGYTQPAAGQGVGRDAGNVKSVSLTLPAKTAQALSHALQLALADTGSTDFEFKISEALSP